MSDYDDVEIMKEFNKDMYLDYGYGESLEYLYKDEINEFCKKDGDKDLYFFDIYIKSLAILSTKKLREISRLLLEKNSETTLDIDIKIEIASVEYTIKTAVVKRTIAYILKKRSEVEKAMSQFKHIKISKSVVSDTFDNRYPESSHFDRYWGDFIEYDIPAYLSFANITIIDEDLNEYNDCDCE